MEKDISTLLREIKMATGWSEPRIASELGTSQPTVNRILNGQDDCKVSTFRAIIALHQQQVSGRNEPGVVPHADRRSGDAPADTDAPSSRPND